MQMSDADPLKTHWSTPSSACSRILNDCSLSCPLPYPPRCDVPANTCRFETTVPFLEEGRHQLTAASVI